ncbi:MoaD/ThiS family protein [Arcanobacterium ihumii]|uniref:MoaD/ThiS family protein n=1 Tax=Arcanobacterium ihumii TaxID=2138162 RepID=UPI000F53A8E7|nr:MoaD/ThiS family protein [Arcanobacterium ihumii]
MNIKLRYFASAAAAAGVSEEHYELPENSTIANLIEAINDKHKPMPNGADLARILGFSSFLLNGARANVDAQIPDGEASVDVLPPFAGG